MAISSPTTIESPAIAQLRDALGADPTAIDQFWRDVEESGAPLFEA